MQNKVAYKDEDLQRIFSRSRSHQSLAVELGISTDSAKKIISRRRSKLVITGYIPAAGRGRPLPTYVWRTHPREKHAVQPVYYTNFEEQCEHYYNRAVAKFRHEMLIDMIFAANVAEILRASAEFDRKMSELPARLKPMYLKRKRVVLPKVQAGVRMIEGQVTPVMIDDPELVTQAFRMPVNQDVFWIPKQA